MLYNNYTTDKILFAINYLNNYLLDYSLFTIRLFIIFPDPISCPSHIDTRKSQFTLHLYIYIILN